MTKKYKISYEYQDSKFEVVDKINDKLFWLGTGIEFELVLKETKEKPEYDDNRVYRTNERQLDTRVDGTTMQLKRLP